LNLQGCFDYCGDQALVYMPFDTRKESQQRNPSSWISTCTTYWQWKSHTPGLSALNRSTI
jgi:hypothetical protein